MAQQKKKKKQQEKTRKPGAKKRAAQTKEVKADDQKVVKGQEIDDAAPAENKIEAAMAKIAEETPKPQITIVAPEEAEELAAIELRPEFPKAVNTAMEIFSQFIMYEIDAPEEARLMYFPANFHITQQQINAEICAMYDAGVTSPFKGDPEDALMVVQGIQDSVSILRKRTGDTFPKPGERGLKDLEFTALSVLAYTEIVTFHRVSNDDLLRRYIQISSRHRAAVNNPEGTRIRQWVAIQVFTARFFDVLADDGIEDKVAAIIEADEAQGVGYAPYILRWREAGLI